MEVVAIWRHPVKSLQGEELMEAAVDTDGLRGDRAWGIRDETTGRILTARREPNLLFASARLGAGGEPEVTLPTGGTLLGTGPEVDAALSEWLQKPVSLVRAADGPGGTAEAFTDATDDTSEAFEWTMPAGRFVDAAPLLVVTTASLRAGGVLHPDGEWHQRRFRPNLLVEADGERFVEDGWQGLTVRHGEVETRVLAPCARCTMVTRPQPGLERDVDIFKTLARHHDGNFGVWSAVTTPGTVRVGDPVSVDGDAGER